MPAALDSGFRRNDGESARHGKTFGDSSVARADARNPTAARKVERDLRARSGAAEGIGALRAPERARRSRSTLPPYRSGNTKSSRAATISRSSRSGCLGEDRQSLQERLG
jgi:hypothetical protein